jgi:Serine/threonine protein phosphatase
MYCQLGMSYASRSDSPIDEVWKMGMDALHSTQYTFALLHERQVDKDKLTVYTGSSPLTSGITVNNHLLPYWQIAVFVVLLLLLMGLVILILARSSFGRRRRILKAELAAAERRATIEAQRIRQAELEDAQRGAMRSPSAPLPAPDITTDSTHQGAAGEHLQPTALACPRCNALNAQDAQYCRYCHFPLTSEAAQQLQASGSPFPARAIDEQPTVVPAGGIAAQPTVVPAQPAIAEQPTIDIMPVGSGTYRAESSGNEQSDAEKTVPYAMRQLREQRMGFIVGTRSDPGIKRRYKPNEDSLFAAQGMLSGSGSPILFGLFVVADGMGGHANGEDASRLAIQTIINYILPHLVKSMPQAGDAYTQLLIDGVQEANLAVHQNNMELRADMGTTITATLQVENIAYVANVGDSRTYLYRPSDGLHKITIDHSVVASLVDAGIIKPDDIYTHPKRHQIYRSLGERPGVEIDTFTVQLQRGDKLLLCSDGLWDMVRDPVIETVIKRADPNPALTGDALIQAALDGGGEDNVSVIVVQMTDAIDVRKLPRLQLIAKPDSVQMPQI